MTLSEYQHQHISAASSVVGVAVRDGVRAGGTQVYLLSTLISPYLLLL